MGKTKTVSTTPASKKSQDAGKTAVKKVKKVIGKDKIKGDLDAMFSTKNKSKVVAKKPAAKKEETNKTAKAVAPAKKSGSSKPAKYTEEGFKIYTAEELKIGQGGDTSDCPFDCNCCF